MRIQFWGTRGSLARPGPATLRYGGNTPCVEANGPDGTLIVLDCGTGAHDLGRHLVASRPQPIRGHLLISHTHWDHIQGFPFFAPLFVPGNEWDVYAPSGRGRRLEETLAGQMEYSYFPLTLGQLGATIRYHDLSEGTFELGAVRVTTRYLNHPGISLGYRLEADGATFVYATDHEPHSPYPRLGDSADDEVHREDRRHIEFLAGAQLVIHDSQYTLEEYRQKMTWGHSPVERVVDFALAARVERLALFHHDPLRTDDAVDWLVDLARARVADAGSSLDVFAAFEGQVIELAARAPAAHGLPPAPAALAPAHLEGPATILMVDDDPEIINLLSLTLQGDGFRLLAASDGDTALAMSRAEHPDLVLLDWSMPGRNGLEVCRALRADPELKLREVPVVMLTVQAEREHTAAGFAAGASDYLVKPFKLTHVRARVHAWLLRSRRARSAGV